MMMLRFFTSNGRTRSCIRPSRFHYYSKSSSSCLVVSAQHLSGLKNAIVTSPQPTPTTTRNFTATLRGGVTIVSGRYSGAHATVWTWTEAAPKCRIKFLAEELIRNIVLTSQQQPPLQFDKKSPVLQELVADMVELVLRRYGRGHSMGNPQAYRLIPADESTSKKGFNGTEHGPRENELVTFNNNLDSERKFVWNEDGAIIFNFGEYEGSIVCDPKNDYFLEWMLLEENDFSPAAKKMVRLAIEHQREPDQFHALMKDPSVTPFRRKLDTKGKFIWDDYDAVVFNFGCRNGSVVCDPKKVRYLKWMLGEDTNFSPEVKRIASLAIEHQHEPDQFHELMKESNP